MSFKFKFFLLVIHIGKFYLQLKSQYSNVFTFPTFLPKTFILFLVILKFSCS